MTKTVFGARVFSSIYVTLHYVLRSEHSFAHSSVIFRQARFPLANDACKVTGELHSRKICGKGLRETCVPCPTNASVTEQEI